jgi:hypothetical protein
MAVTNEALELNMWNSVRKKYRNIITNYARNIVLRRPLQTWRRCETLKLYQIKSTNRPTKSAVRSQVFLQNTFLREYCSRKRSFGLEIRATKMQGVRFLLKTTCFNTSRSSASLANLWQPATTFLHLQDPMHITFNSNLRLLFRYSDKYMLCVTSPVPAIRAVHFTLLDMISATLFDAIY